MHTYTFLVIDMHSMLCHRILSPKPLSKGTPGCAARSGLPARWGVWAVIFIPAPLPEKVPRTSFCTHLFCRLVLQTILGMGMDINVTAQNSARPGLPASARGRQNESRAGRGSETHRGSHSGRRRTHHLRKRATSVPAEGPASSPAVLLLLLVVLLTLSSFFFFFFLLL